MARAFHRRRGVLTGVAAGTVLAVGAAVGTLFLGHSDTNHNLAAASGNGAQVPDDGVGALSATPNKTGGTTSSAQQSTPSVAPMAQATPQAPVSHPQPTTHHRATSGTSSSAGTSAKAPAASSGSGSTTTSTGSSSGGTSTTAPSSGKTSTPSSSGSTSTTPPSTSTTTSTTTGTTTTTPPSSGSSGGLLGSVTSGVTGVLGDVTQPVFNWFG